MKITANNNGVWTLYTALKTTASGSVFIIPGDKKEHHLFSTVRNTFFIRQNANKTRYMQISYDMLQRSKLKPQN